MKGSALGTSDYGVQKNSYAAKHEHRVTEQAKRKEFSKREKVGHTYKTDMGYEDEPKVRNLPLSVSLPLPPLLSPSSLPPSKTCETVCMWRD